MLLKIKENNQIAQNAWEITLRVASVRIGTARQFIMCESVEVQSMCCGVHQHCSCNRRALNDCAGVVGRNQMAVKTVSWGAVGCVRSLGKGFPLPF